jgi:indole-3-glycerol phosphate synthase
MDILERIVIDKRKEVALKKQLVPQHHLEAMALFKRDCISVSKRINNAGSGIIAEHKRRSPSKSVINNNHKVWEVANGYSDAGVSAMSVLTDLSYFGGGLEDLQMARASVDIPLLRKDFTIDPYQIIEAKAYGADFILLIAAVLSRDEIASFSKLAHSLGLEVLLEVHNLEELQKSIMPSLNLIGVNNRNLKTFEVSTQISKDLSTQIPDDFIKVSESGISEVATIKELKTYGYQGFLIGENFMKTDDPGKAASEFVNQL